LDEIEVTAKNSNFVLYSYQATAAK